jgi:hypothetical protein
VPLLCGLLGALLLLVWYFRPREPLDYRLPIISKLDHSHTRLAPVLSACVKDGLVDYKALQPHQTALGDYLRTLSGVIESDFLGWTKPEQTCFVINLHNASVLRLVSEHWPVKSIDDIRVGWRGFEKLRFIRVFGRRLTLAEFEERVFRRYVHDPRAEAALVRGLRSDPPLPAEPWRPGRLEEMLARQAAAPKPATADRSLNQKNP